MCGTFMISMDIGFVNKCVNASTSFSKVSLSIIKFTIKFVVTTGHTQFFFGHN